MRMAVVQCVQEKIPASRPQKSKGEETMSRKVVFTSLLVLGMLLSWSLAFAQGPVDDPSPAPDSPRTVEPLYALPSQPVVAGVDVMLVLDRSGSMLIDYRIDDAKAAAKLFVDQMDLSVDQVGVVSFADDATIDFVLSQNASGVKAAIDGIVATGGTDIALGIRRAQGELASARHQANNLPAMIVLSDGLSDYNAAVAAANAAKEAGTVIFTIGLGADVDQQLMKAIASSGDFYYFAPDGSDLAEIYETLTDVVPLTMDVLEEISDAGLDLAIPPVTGKIKTGETQQLPAVTTTSTGRLMIVVAWEGSQVKVCWDGACKEDDKSPIVIDDPDAPAGEHGGTVTCTADCEEEGDDYVVGVGQEEVDDGDDGEMPTGPVVPEASTLVLMASGLTGLASYVGLRRRLPKKSR